MPVSIMALSYLIAQRNLAPCTGKLQCNVPAPAFCMHPHTERQRLVSQVEQVGFTLKAHGFFNLNPSTGMNLCALAWLSAAHLVNTQPV